MAQLDDKEALIAELARARVSLSRNTAALRQDLDFGTRAKKAFKTSPVPWLGGAAILGLIIARLPFGRKKVVVVHPKKETAAVEQAGKAGLLLGILKIAFDFAKPALLKWATQRFTDYVATAQTRNFGRPPGASR